MLNAARLNPCRVTLKTPQFHLDIRPLPVLRELGAERNSGVRSESVGNGQAKGLSAGSLCVAVTLDVLKELSYDINILSLFGGSICSFSEKRLLPAMTMAIIA